MPCWPDAIDELAAKVARSAAFETFLGEWLTIDGNAADHVHLHELPVFPMDGEAFKLAELEANQRAFALIRTPDEGGLVGTRDRSISNVLFGGTLELELARLVPKDIRANGKMSAVLQQAVVATTPIIEDILAETDGLIWTIESDGHPWRTDPQWVDTRGDYHGQLYMVHWGHPTVSQ